jgi:CHASE3 domain sensor protein
MTTVNMAEDHAKVTEHCVRIASLASISPYFLASCLAVYDRSLAAFHRSVLDVRVCHRTTKVQRALPENYASGCFQMMKAAVRSEFAGDIITARMWISAIPLAEKHGCYDISLKDFTSPEVIAISAAVKDSAEQSTKKLREALLLAKQLNWRSSASLQARSTNEYDAGQAALCAEIVVKCVHARFTTQDQAMITLLDAAVGAAEAHLQQYYRDAHVKFPTLLLREIEALYNRAVGVPAFRESTDVLQKELLALTRDRHKYLRPPLGELYNQLITAFQLDMQLRLEYLFKLETGDVADQTSWLGQSEKRFLREKLSAAQYLVEGLDDIGRRTADLQKYTDELSKLELRCWVGAAGNLQSELDNVLAATGSGFLRKSIWECKDAKLYAMVVEVLITAAKHYQREIRGEWCSDVICLLRNALLWSYNCAEKTVTSIEAQTRLYLSLEDKWLEHYNEKSDRIAMLYARAAAELRASCSLSRSSVTKDQLAAEIYRVASEASVREAEALLHVDQEATPRSDQAQRCMSEINNRSITLAEAMPEDNDHHIVEIYCEWARSVLNDPIGDKLNLHVMRQAHGILRSKKSTAAERGAFTSYMAYHRVWMRSVSRGEDEALTLKLRVVLDQFECETVYDANYQEGNSYHYSGWDTGHLVDVRVNRLGAEVGLRLAATLLSSQMQIVLPVSPVLSPEDHEKVQGHLVTAVKLAHQMYDIRANPSLGFWDGEADDTRQGIVSALKATYEVMHTTLCGAPVDDQVLASTLERCALSEYKVAVLTLLPSVPPDVSQLAWRVFPRHEPHERCEVNRDEYDIAVDAVAKQDPDRLLAVIAVRNAEVNLRHYQRTEEYYRYGANARIVRRKLDVHNLCVKKAQLHLRELHALCVGQPEVAQHLLQARQYVEEALVVAEQMASLPKEANTKAQEKQINRLKAECDAAVRRASAANAPAAGNHKKGKGGKK